ncbi:MAG: hypothetical protein LUD22_04520 [Coprobacillus sp.]|nr:hypothetical protein [Coprobacillus sp.]
MKGTKLLTICSALVLTLSLGACQTEEDITTNDSEAQETETEEDGALNGLGTQDSPYLITNGAQLKNALNAALEEGTQYISIENDISLSSGWDSIGTLNNPVTATIYGNGYTISNLDVNENDTGYYGLIGAFEGYAEDLTIQGQLKVVSDTDLYLGAFAGVTYNSILKGIRADAEIHARSTYSGATAYIGGIVGGNGLDTGLYTVFEELEFTGSIYTNIAGAYVGGLVGVSPNYGTGLSLTNCYVNATSISGGEYTGGAFGYLFSYGSVTNSVVYADTIEATDSSASYGDYAGGIAGYSSYETAILNNIVSVGEISASNSANSYYSSSAGEITGYQYKDQWDNYDDTLGTALANNIVLKNATLTGQTVNDGQAELGALSEDLYESLSFVRAWNYTDGLLSLKPLSDISSDEVDVTIVHNDGTSETTVVKASPNLYTNISIELTREGYMECGLYYDSDCKIDYRYYVPTNGITLYVGWFETSRLAGVYTGEASYNPTIQFRADGSLVILFNDNYISDGWWWCDGEHIVFMYHYLYDNYFVAVWDEASNSFTWLDMNDEDYVYNYKKASQSSIEVPDYTEQGIAGDYYGSNIDGFITISTNGNIEWHKNSPESIYDTGAIRLSGTTVTLSLMGISGTYSYDEDTQTLTKSDGSAVLAANAGEFVTTYNTEDGSVYIHIFEETYYIVINGSLTSYEYEGTLEEGETITIVDNNYLVEGSNLVLQGVAPDKTPLANTYVTTSGASITLVLNADGTGTYDGIAIVWDFDGTYVTFEVNYADVTLEWDAETQTLTGTYDDGEYPVNLTFSVYVQESPATANAAGTWSGSVQMGYSYTLTVNEDGTFTLVMPYNTISGNWSGDLASTFTLDTSEAPDVFDDDTVTCTYNADNDTLKIAYAIYYEDYSFTWSR